MGTHVFAHEKGQRVGRTTAWLCADAPACSAVFSPGNGWRLPAPRFAAEDWASRGWVVVDWRLGRVAADLADEQTARDYADLANVLCEHETVTPGITPVAERRTG